MRPIENFFFSDQRDEFSSEYHEEAKAVDVSPSAAIGNLLIMHTVCLVCCLGCCLAAH